MKRFLSFLLFLILLLPAAAPAETIVTSFYPVWVFTLNLTQGLEDITVRNLGSISSNRSRMIPAFSDPVAF